jgi:hypothetical protein
MYMKRSQPKKAQKSRKIYWIGLAVVAAALLLLAGLELTNTTHLLHKDSSLATRPTSPHRTANSNTKGEPEPGKGTGSPSGNGDKQPGQADGPLVEPSGVFVSNHHPNLSGHPAPNTLQSVCVTTPGATCTIVFTKDGVTKQLPNQIADPGGATYWTWKLQDLGLTTGSWHITAKAMTTLWRWR